MRNDQKNRLTHTPEKAEPLTRSQAAAGIGAYGTVGSTMVAVRSGNSVKKHLRNVELSKMGNTFLNNFIAMKLDSGMSPDEIRHEFGDRIYRQRAEVAHGLKKAKLHSRIAKVAGAIALTSLATTQYFGTARVPNPSHKR